MEKETYLQEDVRKIYAEVNQIINQRFLLLVAAISFFGVVLGWLVSRPISATDKDLGALFYLIPMTYSIILLAFTIHLCMLKNMMRVLTTYLYMSGKSQWESDWATYREDNKDYIGYTKPQAWIFLFLNNITLASPFVFAAVNPVSNGPSYAIVSMVIVGIVTNIIIIGVGLCKWGDNELQAKEKWRKILK